MKIIYYGGLGVSFQFPEEIDLSKENILSWKIKKLKEWNNPHLIIQFNSKKFEQPKPLIVNYKDVVKWLKKHIHVQVKYIEISDNADLFLDKRKEIITLIEAQKNETPVIIKTMPELPKPENNNIKQVLDEEIYQFIKALNAAQLKNLVTYDDAKELFFEFKIAELKKLIN